MDILTTDARFVVDGRADGTFYEEDTFPIDDQRMAMLWMLHHDEYQSEGLDCWRSVASTLG